MPSNSPKADAPLNAWLNFVETLSAEHKITLGLERMKTMLERMNIRFQCPIFTVAGTNGKGSTCAAIEAILRAAGYKVGMHTSPHLIDFTERAVINGARVSEDRLSKAFSAVNDARQDLLLSYFEFTGLAILKVFSDENLDALVLEIGLGGRLDAINALDTDCGIVCALGVDHAALLGNTREAIALEKAHIYRPKTPAICTDRNVPITLCEHVKRIGAFGAYYGKDFETSVHADVFDLVGSWMGESFFLKNLPKPNLKGDHQIQNAAGAIYALQTLHDRLPVTREAICEGLRTVSLPGRFELAKVEDTLGAEILFDVGHNPQAAEQLANNLKLTHKDGEETWAVFGMLKDKDMVSVSKIMSQSFQRWYVAGLDGPRGASGVELMEAMKKANVDADRVSGFGSVSEALFDALNDSLKKNKNSVRIIVFGSFHTVACARIALDRLPHTP